MQTGLIGLAEDAASEVGTAELAGRGRPIEEIAAGAVQAGEAISALAAAIDGGGAEEARPAGEVVAALAVLAVGGGVAQQTAVQRRRGRTELAQGRTVEEVTLLAGLAGRRVRTEGAGWNNGRTGLTEGGTAQQVASRTG